MKTRFLVLSAFAFLLSTISSHADSVVYNTFGPGLTTDSLYGKLIDPGGSFLGTPFSPSTTVDLISLTGSWDSGKFTGPQPPPRTVTISLWTNSNGQPGTELESWQLLVTATPEDYTLSSSLHPLLLSGNTYWALEFFAGGGPGDTIEWGRSSSAPAGGIWSGDSAASLILGFPSFPVAALQVDGTPVSEPSSLILLGSAVLGLGVWRRRGLRHR